MKIVTLNANGLRASIRRGLRDWVKQHNIDILCIQETKAQLSLLPSEEYMIEGYDIFYKDAKKAGYSGVAIYSRYPVTVLDDVIWKNSIAEDEGRIIVVKILDVYIINTYLPSGSSGDFRQAVKWTLLQDFREYLRPWLDKPVIVLGDLNVAHQKIDLKNWRGNQKQSGFLPYEREWFDGLIADGWVDTLRHVDPAVEVYSWWSYRGKARINNAGWRIDYQLVPKPYTHLIKDMFIDNQHILSDHAPYVVDYHNERL